MIPRATPCACTPWWRLSATRRDRACSSP
jgi:hypothetical protein